MVVKKDFTCQLVIFYAPQAIFCDTPPLHLVHSSSLAMQFPLNEAITLLASKKSSLFKRSKRESTTDSRMKNTVQRFSVMRI